MPKGTGSDFGTSGSITERVVGQQERQHEGDCYNAEGTTGLRELRMLLQ